MHDFIGVQYDTEQEQYSVWLAGVAGTLCKYDTYVDVLKQALKYHTDTGREIKYFILEPRQVSDDCFTVHVKIYGDKSIEA